MSSSTPLTSIECELLERVAQHDEGAAGVLADYWIEHVDVDRGAFVLLHLGANAERIDLAPEEARIAVEHVQRWRAPFVRNAFAEEDLIFADGFLQYPLSLPEEHALDGSAELIRISPRYFREREPALSHGHEYVVYEAQTITPRTTMRAVVKVPIAPELRELLEHEEAMLSRVKHPNIVRSYGWVVRPHGTRALALEWAGCDLQTLIAAARKHRQLLGNAFAISVGVQLAEALVALHAAEVIHTAIRPAHIAITSDGVVRLIGFGFARAPGHHYRRYARSTLTYLSPEQAVGRAIDRRTDVFSAAAVIAELASNQRVFTGTNDLEVLTAIRDANVSLALPAPLSVALASSFERRNDERSDAVDLRAALVQAARIMRLEIGPHVIAQRLVELGVPT